MSDAETGSVVFIPGDELGVLDLPRVRRDGLPGLWAVRRDIERMLKRPQPPTAFLVRFDSGLSERFWLLPREVVTSTDDDGDWGKVAAQVLRGDSLPRAAAGDPPTKPVIVVDGEAVSGAWIPPEARYETKAAAPDTAATEPHPGRTYPRVPAEGPHEAAEDTAEAVVAAGDAKREPEESGPHAAAAHDRDEPAGSTSGGHERDGAAPSDTAPSIAARRAALRQHIAAHNGVRAALDRERSLRDDRQAVALLDSAGRRVLTALEAVLNNDDLWLKLAATDREPLTADELGQLEAFANDGLRGLLVGLDYREPPPVDDLIDDTLTSLALTLDPHAEPGVHARRVATAQSDLSLFAIRLRRLISASQTPSAPFFARRLLRIADRDADALMTAVVPVLVEAAAELRFPGAGIALKLAGAAGGVAASRLLALRPRFGQEDAETSDHDDIAATLDRAAQAMDRLAPVAKRRPSGEAVAPADRVS